MRVKSFERGGEGSHQDPGKGDLSWALRSAWEMEKQSHREWHSVKREQQREVRTQGGQVPGVFHGLYSPPGTVSAWFVI